MQQKNTFLLLALSGSMLMVMMVSTLLFLPHTDSLQANITLDAAPTEPARSFFDTPIFREKPEDIQRAIQQAIADNRPDEAKKLYEELHFEEKYK
jgi:hypothetical protein